MSRIRSILANVPLLARRHWYTHQGQVGDWKGWVDFPLLGTVAFIDIGDVYHTAW